MTPLITGTIAGLVFGLVTVATMLPIEFPDKRAALSAAFVERFGIGLVISCTQLPWPGSLSGAFLGLLLSMPSAIITRSYAPILIMGTAGGAIIGGLARGWL